MAKIMITNGGPHPADKWAEMTTDTLLDLIQIAEDSVTDEAAAARQAKRDLRTSLFNIFNTHHDRVQKHERGDLAKHAKKIEHVEERIASGADVERHMSVMDEVDAALAATPFAAHFANPEVRAVVKTIVGQHTADAMHIERSWHRDRLAEKGV